MTCTKRSCVTPKEHSVRKVAFPLVPFEGPTDPEREKTLLDNSRLGLPTTALVLLGFRGFKGCISWFRGLPELALEGDSSSNAGEWITQRGDRGKTWRPTAVF